MASRNRATCSVFDSRNARRLAAIARTSPYREGVERLVAPNTDQEDTMDAKLLAESEALLRTTERMLRVGLIVDRNALSPAHRRALFALQCQFCESPDEPEPKRAKIGFPYPNER
jgi:hypothetical protein